MPLIPLVLDDDLHLSLKNAAEEKGLSILDYVRYMLTRPQGKVLEIEGEPGQGLPIQPAAALDDECRCGSTRRHLIEARQRLLEVSTGLGYPLAEIEPPRLPMCLETNWLAQRILAEIAWIDESMEADAYQVVDASRVIAKANVADDFDPFWMVIRDLGDGHAVSATKRHPAMFLAEQEAERLCSKERKPFLIFQAVARCDAGPTPINWRLAKDHRP